MKIVILDRDGVINHESDAYIKSPAEFKPIKDSLEAIVRLNFAGYLVTVATNQSGIARGLFDNYTLQSIHRKMADLLFGLGGKIDAVFYCPHANVDNCDCRKPKSGMLKSILSGFNIAAKDAIVIGDSLRDLQAGIAAGVKSPILVETGKGAKTLQDPKLPKNTPVFTNLAAAVENILKTAK